MESFVRRLRWKAFFDSKTAIEQNNHDKFYRFKSERCHRSSSMLEHYIFVEIQGYAKPLPIYST